MIQTSRFYLRPLKPEDATQRYLLWLEDENAKKYIVAAVRTHNIQNLSAFIKEKNDKIDVLFLGIFERDTAIHIGNIKYEPVNRILKYATMGILIGDISYRGKGVAGEVITASAFFLRDSYSTHQIVLGVESGNAPAIKAYRKIGFEVKETDYIRNHPKNVITMVWELPNKADSF